MAVTHNSNYGAYYRDLRQQIIHQLDSLSLGTEQSQERIFFTQAQQFANQAFENHDQPKEYRLNVSKFRKVCYHTPVVKEIAEKVNQLNLNYTPSEGNYIPFPPSQFSTAIQHFFPENFKPHPFEIDDSPYQNSLSIELALNWINHPRDEEKFLELITGLKNGTVDCDTRVKGYPLTYHFLKQAKSKEFKLLLDLGADVDSPIMVEKKVIYIMFGQTTGTERVDSSLFAVAVDAFFERTGKEHSENALKCIELLLKTVKDFGNDESGDLINPFELIFDRDVNPLKRYSRFFGEKACSMAHLLIDHGIDVHQKKIKTLGYRPDTPILQALMDLCKMYDNIETDSLLNKVLHNEF
jgi:hypothetical protein